MNLVPLSPETQRRVDILFPPGDRAEATELLVNECGSNLPFLDELDMFELERFRFAALKLSDGRLEGLREAVSLAKTDWRDLLVFADFGDDVTAHQQWLPAVRDAEHLGHESQPPPITSGAPVIEYGTKVARQRVWGLARPVWLLIAGFCGAVEVAAWIATNGRINGIMDVVFVAALATAGSLALVNAIRAPGASHPGGPARGH